MPSSRPLWLNHCSWTVEDGFTDGANVWLLSYMADAANFTAGARSAAHARPAPLPLPAAAAAAWARAQPL